MIPSKIKTLIDKYCMGIVPSDEQMDEIMNLAVFLNADASEVSAYIKKMVDGPTKSEREAAAKEAAEKKRQSEELRAKKAKEEAEAKARAEEGIRGQDIIDWVNKTHARTPAKRLKGKRNIDPNKVYKTSEGMTDIGCRAFEALMKK